MFYDICSSCSSCNSVKWPTANAANVLQFTDDESNNLVRFTVKV